MARLRTSILHWGNKYDGPDTYKDGRRGALDDALWDEDELVDMPAKRDKKKRVRKPGCPANNGKSHVYVWDTVKRRWWTGSRWHEYSWNRLVCCGCEKEAPYRMKRRRWW